MSRLIARHPETYFHVVDEDNGEHIATYTSERKANFRKHNEQRNGRDFCAVVIGEVA